MALKPKHPHICIDQQIWDDPVMMEISSDAFRSYIFAIAWSKNQAGRSPDGLLTQHGISRIGATLEQLQSLTEKKLLEKCKEGYRIVKYDEWQKTSAEEKAQAERVEAKSAQAKAAIAVRWNKTEPVIEEGFNVDEAFAEAWGNWPEANEARFTEKQAEAQASFRENITNSKDWSLFQAALMKRLKDYHSENRPKAERRKFLGAFKNFCVDRWRDWIPKSHQEMAAPPPPAAHAEEEAGPAPDPEMERAREFLKQNP